MASVKDVKAPLDNFLMTHVSNTCQDLTQIGEGGLASQLRKVAYMHRKSRYTQCAEQASIIVKDTWEKLKGEGAWPHVCWREAYVLGQLLVAHSNMHVTKPEDYISTVTPHLDMASILGGPTEILQCLLNGVTPTIAQLRENSAANCNSIPMELPIEKPTSPKITTVNAIPRIHAPTLEEFKEKYFETQTPIILTGVTETWPAMKKWMDMRNLCKQHGYRVVPVEIGLPSHSDWTETTMTLSHFISDIILPNSNTSQPSTSCKEGISEHLSIGYLAQHTLFDQIPQLQDDFSLPPYCELGTLKNINTWLGTGGTVTPLHIDSYDNFLTQVVGYKFIRLYAPSQTSKVYPNVGGEAASKSSKYAQGNISLVDVENPDLERYPHFSEAEYTEAVLGPGDMLFIPQLYWHYVRSLSTSWSLNFWF